MKHSCQYCLQVGTLLAKGLEATTKAARKWTWKALLQNIITSAVAGCEFCCFLDYVLLQPWYGHEAREPLQKSGELCDFLDRTHNAASKCIVCTGTNSSQRHEYMCYKCLPRIAKAIADNIKTLASTQGQLLHPVFEIDIELSLELDENYPGSLYIQLENALSDYGTTERQFTLTATDLSKSTSFKPGRDYNLTLARACEQVKSWLVECDRHGCKPQSSTLPKRLLDVGTLAGGTTRLIQGDQCHGSYVALSYCWGGAQPFSTTSHNLRAYSDGIRIHTMPATIQDAIYVTHRLGIQYLWVDSLCIIQDSPDDKALQIAAMDQVYMNAYLTLSASRASKCDEGFANSRNSIFDFSIPQNLGVEALRNLEDLNMVAQRDRPDDISCRIPCSDPGKGVQELTLRRRVGYELALEPVSRRAWAYQERLLSPRIVNFGKCLTWLCSQHREIDPCTGDIWAPTRGNLINLSKSNRDWAKTDPSKERESLMSLWQDIVMEYSNREMSLSSDKLPAMAGLAKRFGQFKQHDQYLAGLWRSHMPHDLFWFPQSSGKRPETWRAPSWSWASINGSVRFHSAEDTIHGDNSLVGVLSYHYTNVDTQFGKLLSGALVVRGRIGKTTRTLYTYHEPREPSPPVTVVREMLCPSHILGNDPHSTSYQDSQRIFIDEEVDKMMTQDESNKLIKEGWSSGDPVRRPKVLGSRPAWLLPIRGMLDFDLNVSLEHYDLNTRIDDLLLEPVGDDTYRRIGIFEILKFDPAEHVEWSELHDIQLV